PQDGRHAPAPRAARAEPDDLRTRRGPARPRRLAAVPDRRVAGVRRVRPALSFTRTAAACGEIVAALAAATALVALLEGVAPVAGLGVLYLLAVFFVAVR